MQGDTVAGYMALVHRVQVATCTSQRGHGHYIACGYRHDLRRAAVDRTAACRALEVALEISQVAVADEAQKDWHHHRMQGLDRECASLDAQDSVTPTEAASHGFPPAWCVPLDSYQRDPPQQPQALQMQRLRLFPQHQRRVVSQSE